MITGYGPDGPDTRKAPHIRDHSAIHRAVVGWWRRNEPPLIRGERVVVRRESRPPRSAEVIRAGVVVEVLYDDTLTGGRFVGPLPLEVWRT